MFEVVRYSVALKKGRKWGHGAREADVVHLVCRAGTVRNLFSKEYTMCVCKHASIQLKNFCHLMFAKAVVFSFL